MLFVTLVPLTREIGDGPCFLYIEFSWIGVLQYLSLFFWVLMINYGCQGSVQVFERLHLIVACQF